MKYTFDEKSLLALFTDPDNTVFTQYREPHTRDGYVLASDGHILLRIKADTLRGTYAPTDKMSIKLPEESSGKTIAAADIQKALSEVPQIDETINTGEDEECEECDGTGLVFWEYNDRKFVDHEMEADCPICGGSGFSRLGKVKKTGRKVPDPEACIRIFSFCISAKHLQKMLSAMMIMGTDEATLVAQTFQLSVFRIDGNIQIIIANYITDKPCTKIDL